tara:strand:- start:4561 stop:4728 length:168 start_codon:yes stop_codon:yes gene_type:complete
MGKNRNRHKNKNKPKTKTPHTNTLGDFFIEQGISIKKLKDKLTTNEEKKANKETI